MTEKFIKKEHYLDYDVKPTHSIKLGFTRENGLSHYPEHAFNMARYVDDNQANITQHQEILANEIGFDRNNWVSQFRHMEIKSQKLLKNIEV